MQPPGRVDQQNLAALVAGLLEGLVGEPSRIRPGGAGDDPAAGALAPDLQLLHPCGAERVAGREHHVVSRVAVLLGELGDRCRFAAAVDADDENYERLAPEIEPQRLHHRLDETNDFLGKRAADLLGRDFLVEAGPAQFLGDLGGDPGTHVARNQQFFELE